MEWSDLLEDGRHWRVRKSNKCWSCDSPKDTLSPCQCGSLRNKANNVIKPEMESAIRERLAQGWSTRRIASDVGVAKDTVTRHRRLFLAEEPMPFVCPCGRPAGHRGWCVERTKLSPARQAFLSKWKMLRPPKIVRLTSPLLSGHGLVLLVNGAVPKSLPPQVREDVCQEILIGMLAGEFTEAEMPNRIKDATSRVRREQEGHFLTLSLDTPRRDGRSWHDMLAADDELGSDHGDGDHVEHEDATYP